jgi:hypothetical protein
LKSASLPFKEKHVLNLSKGDSLKARLSTAEWLVNAFSLTEKSRKSALIRPSGTFSRKRAKG